MFSVMETLEDEMEGSGDCKEKLRKAREKIEQEGLWSAMFTVILIKEIFILFTANIWIKKLVKNPNQIRTESE